MNIGIDARFVAKGRGLGEFSRQLIYGLAELDLDHRYYIYTTKKAEHKLAGLPERFHLRWVVPEYVTAEQVHMPWLMHHDRLDLLHAVNNTAPLWVNLPVILTIHDMMFSAKSQIIPPSASMYQRLGRMYYDVISQQVAPKARRVVTDSVYSQQDVCRILNLDQQQVAVIYGGVGREFQPSTVDQQQQIRSQYGLPEQYLFALGAVDPRKQTGFLVEQFLTFARSQDTIDLVISGMQPDQSEPLKQQAIAAGLGHRIHFVGFVPVADLVQLIAAAKVFVFPSLYEGFGLPVLQAMACGVPVISSNTSSLPEVGGPAVYYIDPTDGPGMVEAMRQVISDTRLHQQLATAGLQRAASFTWKETARHYVELYRGSVS